MKTEEKIVTQALKMFNERGIEYVGLRELAKTLMIRVSNINYYFPTKDDLVNRLSLDLSKQNEKIVVADKELTMLSFLERLRKVFKNHVKYRCLLISIVHLMEQNKPMAQRYKKTQQNRNSALTSNLNFLHETGFLKISAEEDISFLVSMIALTARFWVSEAAVSFKDLSSNAQIQHYTGQIAKLLVPYATAKGKKEINEFLKQTR